jgi:hypothetical protein
VAVYPNTARLGSAMMNCSSDQQQFEEFHLMKNRFSISPNCGPLPTTIIDYTRFAVFRNPVESIGSINTPSCHHLQAYKIAASWCFMLHFPDQANDSIISVQSESFFSIFFVI